MKRTLVLGASPKSTRISNAAVTQLVQHGFEVIAIGNTPGQIDTVPIICEKPILEDIHTVTLYLNPSTQQGYEAYILSLQPKRIIFNPGSENPDFAKKAEAHGIETLCACTLVMLSLQVY